MPKLIFNHYGKTQVRLTQVLRNGGRHDLVELSTSILFQGDFAESYTEADNSKILPTDTMKNTVYAMARKYPIVSIEEFARNLARHFLAGLNQLEQVQVEIEQRPWSRIRDHKSAFMLGGQERRLTTVTADRHGERIISGVHGLEILKTANSAFEGFLKDDLTTLPETRDRLLGTVLDANWMYQAGDIDFNAEYEHVRSVLLETFANHVSESVQHTVFDMAAAALRSSGTLREVHLVMPNKHRLLVDLARFGLDNPNQIFVPTDEPSGYIEARVSADQSPHLS
jgi:urate oxidase